MYGLAKQLEFQKEKPNFGFDPLTRICHVGFRYTVDGSAAYAHTFHSMGIVYRRYQPL